MPTSARGRTIRPDRAVTPAGAFAVAALGIALFSAMDVLMKGLAIAIGTYAALLWRTGVQLGLSAAIWGLSGPRRPTRAAFRLHLVRGALTTVMAILFFWGLARLPMAQAIALSFVAPLAAIGLAAATLGEPLTRRTLSASLVAFAGVLVIVAGQRATDLGPDAFRGALAVLASAACYAWNIILMRRQALVAGSAEIAVFQAGVMTLLLAAAAPVLLVWPPAALWPAIGGAALLATGSALLLAFAYARAPASLLAPTEYTGFVWASIYGWAVFGEALSAYTLAGATLIVAGCLVAARARPATTPEILP